MKAWVLLLRGINVGGHGKLPMAELRALLSSLGANDVASYIQSGNAVFTGTIDARSFGETIEDAIESAHGFRPRSLVLSEDAFASILAAYPWPEAFDNPNTGHIWFFSDAPDAPALDALEPLAAASERFKLGDHAFYLYAPDGIGRSKLAEKVERKLGVPTTARNLRTALKIADLLKALTDS
jgi:uncharacterized protein (DUF1697 family)